MNKYKATTFVRTLYVWWKTYRADKDWIIVADTPEVEKMCKAYKFECVEEPKKETRFKAEEEIDAVRMNEELSLDENVVVEVPATTKKK